MRTARKIHHAPKTRKMRICNRYFERQSGRFAIFPDIRLCGRWLMESGFEAGQYIRVAHERHKILITLLPDENNDKNTSGNEKT